MLQRSRLWNEGRSEMGQLNVAFLQVRCLSTFGVDAVASQAQK